MERGEFDNLPGAGKPIPALDKPHDELWWITQKLRRENLSYLPATLALRKEAEDGSWPRSTERSSTATARRRRGRLNLMPFRHQPASWATGASRRRQAQRPSTGDLLRRGTSS
jgi:hypothetical protein